LLFSFTFSPNKQIITLITHTKFTKSNYENNQKKRKEKKKENPNLCLPNKAIIVQIHWRRTTKSCSLVARSCSFVEPHHVVRQSLSENWLCLTENRVSSVNSNSVPVLSATTQRRSTGDSVPLLSLSAYRGVKCRGWCGGSART